LPKLPAIQFYPGDWLRDAVAGCSLAAQGLWLRLMFVAHDADNYGYLSANGLPLPADGLARRCGCSVDEFHRLIAELEAAGVPSRLPDGIMYSRRMVRDAENRAADAERQRKHRGRHGSVTRMSHRSSSSLSTSKGKTNPMSAGADAGARISQPFEPTKESQAREPEQLELGQLREKNPASKLLLEIYEQERGPLPAVKVESRERLSNARTLLLSRIHDQEKFLADFRAAVRKASQIVSPTGWRPAFDWFVANGTNYAKVLEGNYDKWASGNGGTNGSARNGNGKDSGGAVRPEPGRTKPAAAVFSNGNTLTQ